jgi:chromosome segregation ATPase
VPGDFALDHAGTPEPPAQRLLSVGAVPADALGRVRIIAAPAALTELRSLEAANRELRRANQQLARERLGRSDAAAGTLVARSEALAARNEQMEAEHAQLRREHEAWVERCLGAEAREQALQARLSELEQRYDAILVRVVAKAWQRAWRR